ncbi:MAG: hypothetical protein K0V04_29700 [Deltaproteobacteria bacterium]|nr:hypothetical protein [Deltaproteobacteria bacterium]
MALAVATAFIVHARGWVFLCDDAFISFRYARNLAEHGAVVFNIGVDPPEMVEGYTNFAWVVVLAGLHAVGWAPPEAADALTQLGALAGMVAAVVLVRTLRRRFAPGGDPRLQALDLVPAVLLVSVPEHMVWSHSGLETSWAGAVTIGAMAAWSADRYRTAAILAAVTALLRPDGLLPIAAFGVVWLLVVGGPVLWRERAAAWARVPRRRMVQAAMLFTVPLVVHLLWRRSYYGEWLPNTWAIKAHGALLRETYGTFYVQAWLEAMPLVYLAPLLLALRPRHALAVVPAAMVVGYGYWVGGDFMAYSRFYVVATGLLAVLVGWLLADTARWIEGRTSVPIAHAVALLVAVAMAAALGRQTHARWTKDMAKSAGWIDGKWEGVAAMDRFARVGHAVGQWMHDNLPPQTLISVGAAGAVPYGAQLPIVDGFGLVDPHLVHMPKLRPRKGPGARPGHQIIAPVSYMKERDPDLLCHVGYRGARRPGERRVHPAFRRGYAWACIELPPVVDPRAPGGERDVGVYCCRRPRDREVGPFGRRER